MPESPDIPNQSGPLPLMRPQKKRRLHRELREKWASMSREGQIYWIDHYSGKERTPYEPKKKWNPSETNRALWKKLKQDPAWMARWSVNRAKITKDAMARKKRAQRMGLDTKRTAKLLTRLASSALGKPFTELPVISKELRLLANQTWRSPKVPLQKLYFMLFWAYRRGKLRLSLKTLALMLDHLEEAKKLLSLSDEEINPEFKKLVPRKVIEMQLLLMENIRVIASEGKEAETGDVNKMRNFATVLKDLEAFRASMAGESVALAAVDLPPGALPPEEPELVETA